MCVCLQATTANRKNYFYGYASSFDFIQVLQSWKRYVNGGIDKMSVLVEPGPQGVMAIRTNSIAFSIPRTCFIPVQNSYLILRCGALTFVGYPPHEDRETTSAGTFHSVLFFTDHRDNFVLRFRSRRPSSAMAVQHRHHQTESLDTSEHTNERVMPEPMMGHGVEATEKTTGMEQPRSENMEYLALAKGEHAASQSSHVEPWGLHLKPVKQVSRAKKSQIAPAAEGLPRSSTAMKATNHLTCLLSSHCLGHSLPWCLATST